MPQAVSVHSRPVVQSSQSRLFRHSKRHRWGVAALVWERDGKRGYQFSDGKLRVFKQGYYHMFESAVAPGDGSGKAVMRLARLARSEDVSEATRLPTLRDQIELFRREFPGGFQGEEWTKRHRGTKARKRLKRHREAALADAALLSAEELEVLIAGQNWTEVHRRLVEVASCSNLVPSAQLKKLRALKPSSSLAEAANAWLHGAAEDGPTADRQFNRFARELGAAASWQLVTCFAALVHPHEHACVRPRVHTLQAKMLLANFEAQKRPNGAAYRRYQSVAKIVHDELAAAGFVARDRLDVYDFMWNTQRPAARETLLAIPMIRSIDAKREDSAPKAEEAGAQAEAVAA